MEQNLWDFMLKLEGPIFTYCLVQSKDLVEYFEVSEKSKQTH